MERELEAKVPRAVLGTIRRTTQQLIEVRTKDGVVVTTPEHPFAKIGSGWTPAGELAEGDLVVSRTSPRGTPILAVTTRAVPPTTVYNLTVDKTHSYLVGRQSLLVHNVDCRLGDQANWEPITRRPTLGEYLAHERENDRLEALRREAEARERENAGRPNCPSCVLAVLADQGPGNRPNTGDEITPNDMVQLMYNLGVVTSGETPEPKTVPVSSSTAERLKNMAEGKTRPDSNEFDKLQAESDKFMKDSPSNTFAVTFEFYDGQQYQTRTAVAVRGPDGNIVYLDPTKRPPELKLDELTTSIEVTPTNVDWRYNRHLKNMVDAAQR